MKLHAVIHKAEEGGYWAEVPALPGCVTQAETMPELETNLREAIEDGNEPATTPLSPKRPHSPFRNPPMTPPSKSKLLSGFTVAASMLLPVITASGASVRATLLGDEVTASISDGSVWSQSPAIVDATVEFKLVLTNVTFTADIGSNEITLTYENTSQFPDITIPPLSFRFYDLNWTCMPDYVVTSVVPLSSNFPGLIASTFTSDSMTLHMPLTNTNPADRFFTSFRIDAQVIPEPPATLITGMGLLLIAWQARGRRYVGQEKQKAWALVQACSSETRT